jgi:tetratricopeptide (TPR) repeat protein
MPSTVCRLPGFFLLAALLPIPSAAGAPQQPSDVILESSEELFCVLAAINAAGYDTGIGIDTGNSTREEVRALLAKESIPIVPELRQFYTEHQVADDAAADLGQYVSLALLLKPPPAFGFVVPETDLPPDAKALRGLVPLLRAFYQQAGLASLWGRLQPRYEAEIARYSQPVRRSIDLSDAYLRSPSGAYLGRTYTIYLSLLGAPGQVQARIYQADYYLVITLSQQSKIDEIRHQYLHFLLDPLALKYAPEIHEKESLISIARKAPALGADFKDDFSLLLTECLIKAIELRMDKTPKAVAQKKVGELAASGLILVPYFYDTLADYEQQESALSVFYKTMVAAIDLKAEAKDLAAVKFTQPAAQRDTPTLHPATPALTEDQRLVSDADNLFYEGKYNEARAAYQGLLEKDPKNERALFGMAIVAANTRKPDTAQQYFTKTLDVARDLRIATWSHIYLGRLYDLLGKRQDAVAQYRAAALTAAAYPTAQAAAQEGLAKAYGSK